MEQNQEKPLKPKRTLKKELQGYLLICIPPLPGSLAGSTDHWNHAGGSRTLFEDKALAIAAQKAAIPRQHSCLRDITRVKHWELDGVITKEMCRPYGEYLKGTETVSVEGVDTDVEIIYMYKEPPASP